MMRHSIFIWFPLAVTLFFIGCGQSKKPVHQSTAQSSEHHKSDVQRNPEDIPPPPPPPPIELNESEQRTQKQKDENKVDRELNELFQATKTRVLESLGAEKEKFFIDTIGPSNQTYIKSLADLTCEQSRPKTSRKFHLADIEDYVHSSAKTEHPEDGKKFCLYGWSNPDNDQCKIVYSRTEGGHAADAIALIVVDRTAGVAYTLNLLSWYGKEGLIRVIESEVVDQRTFKRKITEHLGWAADSRSQPRIETTQIFELSLKGEIQLTSEETTNYNIEKYLD